MVCRIHRVLVKKGIESHVVDASSLQVSRRRRLAKTDRIDREKLLGTLMAYKGGEPRVCAMVRVRSPDQEDVRRICRDRKVLIGERVRHINHQSHQGTVLFAEDQELRAVA